MKCEKNCEEIGRVVVEICFLAVDAIFLAPGNRCFIKHKRVVNQVIGIINTQIRVGCYFLISVMTFISIRDSRIANVLPGPVI